MLRFFLLCGFCGFAATSVELQHAINLKAATLASITIDHGAIFAEVEEMAKRLTEAESSIKATLEELDLQEHGLSDLALELKIALQTKDFLDGNVTKLVKETHESLETLEKATSSLKVTEDNHKMLKSAARIPQSEVAVLLETNYVLGRSVVALENDTADLQASIAALKTDLTATAVTLEACEARSAAKDSEISSLSTQLQAEKAAYEAEKVDLSAKVRVLSEENRVHKSQAQERDLRVQSLEKTLAERNVATKKAVDALNVAQNETAVAHAALEKAAADLVFQAGAAQAASNAADEALASQVAASRAASEAAAVLLASHTAAARIASDAAEAAYTSHQAAASAERNAAEAALRAQLHAAAEEQSASAAAAFLLQGTIAELKSQIDELRREVKLIEPRPKDGITILLDIKRWMNQHFSRGA
jgi:hypothetical protein